jgi:glycine cleavage system H protein
MTEISKLILPEDVRYTNGHEWTRKEGDIMRIGVSDYAQAQLGDIVFVELPRVGDTFAQNEEFGLLEAVKAISELYMPVGGVIVAVNNTLKNAPKLVNSAPYSDGWILDVNPDDPAEFEVLMDKNAYHKMLKNHK